MAAAAGTRWRYRAADASGATVAGEIEAPTAGEAVDALRRRALWVTTLEPAARTAPPIAVQDGAASTGLPAAAGTGRRWWQRLTGPSADAELAVTVRAMSALLGAGVPLEQALAYAAGDGSETATAFDAVRRDVRGGAALSAAVARQGSFPAVFGPTLAAAEASGTLGDALAVLALHLERADAVRARLRAALAYPAVLGVASVVGMTVILLVVVPRFATLVADAGGTLPWSTRALVAVSAVLVRWWWLLLAGLAVAPVAARGWLAAPANRARWDAARLTLPVIGRLERTRWAAAYAGTLAIALRAGVALLPAMRLARAAVGNGALGVALTEAERRVENGGALAAALAGTLPPLAVRLLDAGEASGQLASLAGRAAEAADEETARAVGGAVALVEPVLILGFGGVVGFVALALLQAIYGLNARGL